MWPSAGLRAGVEQAAWQLMSGGQVGPSGSREAGKLDPMRQLLGSRTCSSDRDLDLLPRLLLVPWLILLVHSFLSSESGRLIG